jgi:purine-binding chemotaxis protein CheW
MSSTRDSSTVDWTEMRRRLDESRRTIDRLSGNDPESREQMLRERARKLAQIESRTVAAATVERIEVLAFHVGGERYAFEAHRVAQVFPISPITAIPGVPDFVVGIVASGGAVLSVIDLRSLLDLPLAGLQDPTAIIVLRSETMEFGILAESIVGIEHYPLHALEHALPTLSNIEKTYLKGVAPDRTAILDTDRLLSDPRLVVDEGQL